LSPLQLALAGGEEEDDPYATLRQPRTRARACTHSPRTPAAHLLFTHTLAHALLPPPAPCGALQGRRALEAQRELAAQLEEARAGKAAATERQVGVAAACGPRRREGAMWHRWHRPPP
jgi:hypothetical protein